MEKKHYNEARANKAKIITLGGKSVFSIEFQHPEWDGEYDIGLNFWLEPDSNDKNLSMLAALGVKDLPNELTPKAALDLKVMRGTKADLTVDHAGKYPKVYLATPGYLTVFDNRK